MDILKNEILPLFEVTQSSSSLPNSSNDLLVETSINHYSLCVDLKDVYLNKSQHHTIQIDDTTLQYTIPLYYYEIILSGKGHYQEDIIINIYSKLNPSFIRVNDHDLLTVREMSFNQYKMGYVMTFTHIDDSSIVSVPMIPGQKFYKISHLGLPKPNKTRGSLYVWVDLIADDLEESIELDAAHNSDSGLSGGDSSSDSSSGSSGSSGSSDSSSSSTGDDSRESGSEENNKNDSKNDSKNIKVVGVNKDLQMLLEFLNFHQHSNI